MSAIGRAGAYDSLRCCKSCGDDIIAEPLGCAIIKNDEAFEGEDASMVCTSELSGVSICEEDPTENICESVYCCQKACDDANYNPCIYAQLDTHSLTPAETVCTDYFGCNVCPEPGASDGKAPIDETEDNGEETEDGDQDPVAETEDNVEETDDPSDGGAIEGDPHIKTFQGKWFDCHGVFVF